MRGFYRTKNIAPNLDVVYGAVSKFEPTHARRSFPCFDEPDFKATFDVTLVGPRDRLFLSNMVKDSPSFHFVELIG